MGLFKKSSRRSRLIGAAAKKIRNWRGKNLIFFRKAKIKSWQAIFTMVLTVGTAVAIVWPMADSWLSVSLADSVSAQLDSTCLVSPAGGTYATSTSITIKCGRNIKQLIYQWDNNASQTVNPAGGKITATSYSADKTKILKIKALRVNLSPRAPKDDYSQINLNYVFRSRPVNGACGQDNGAALSAVPVNLCRSGTASAVAGIGPWSWSCKGLKGGATASCRAKKNEINIKILSNGTSIMTPADVTLYAGQPVSISITSDVMKIDKEIVFFPTNKDGDQTGYGELYSLKLCKDYIKFYSVEVCPLNQIKVTFTPPKSWLGVYDIRLNVWERWFSTNVAAGKDIRLNIKVKNDDLLGKIDQGKCVGVINNGDSSNKLDIVFVADGYADISKFTNDVNQLIQTLLTPEPLKSNSKGINFYRIDRIGSLQPAGVDPFTGPAPFYWKDMVAKCAGYDLVAVIKNTTTSTPKAYFDDNPKWLFTGMNWPLSTIIHEFGHAFADLGDEYANLGTVFFSTDSIWGRVNIDKTGCPKWCSGNVNTGATIESAIYHEQDQTREKCTFNCYDAYQKVNECLKSKGIINGGFDSSFECWRSAQTDNKKCQADASQCNFGVDCRDNLGCYWNARAINTFKSTATSAMQDSSLSIYNSISQKAILNELKKYIK